MNARNASASLLRVRPFSPAGIPCLHADRKENPPLFGMQRDVGMVGPKASGKRPAVSCQYLTTHTITPESASSDIGAPSHELPQKDSQKNATTPKGNYLLEREPMYHGFNPESELPTPESECLDLHSLLPPHLGAMEGELPSTLGEFSDLDMNYDGALIRNLPDLSTDESTQLVSSVPPPSPALKLSQHSMEAILRVTRAWPRMIAKGIQLPPIIHPSQLSDDNIATPLANCFALVKMWDGQRGRGIDIVQQTVKREFQAIISSFYTFEERDLVAALQALTIYKLLLLFPSNDQLSVSRLDDKLVKQLRIFSLYVVTTGMVLEEESKGTRPLHECWVSVTCKRRALLSLYTIHWAYSVYHSIPAFGCDELRDIPAPAAKYLWQANSREEWEALYNRWLAQWEGPYYSQGELLDINTGVRIDPRAELWLEDTDEFGMIFVAIDTGQNLVDNPTPKNQKNQDSCFSKADNCDCWYIYGSTTCWYMQRTPENLWRPSQTNANILFFRSVARADLGPGGARMIFNQDADALMSSTTYLFVK
ncbi:hypothetical protein ACJ72_02791 [Emergomyces africanus]|uniref:Transcription factor domain-containing protein n=1 Tax=Emergomyces africanus TaxID=1955775 RepID=A0A1B7P1F7_9EURO|nr:hypothetical protein ACJ72_02791 [Emergomyces africanus]